MILENYFKPVTKISLRKNFKNQLEIASFIFRKWLRSKNCQKIPKYIHTSLKYSMKQCLKFWTSSWGFVHLSTAQPYSLNRFINTFLYAIGNCFADFFDNFECR